MVPSCKALERRITNRIVVLGVCEVEYSTLEIHGMGITGHTRVGALKFKVQAIVDLVFTPP